MQNPVEFDTQLAAIRSNLSSIYYAYDNAVAKLQGCFDGRQTLSEQDLIMKCLKAGQAARFADTLKTVAESPELIEKANSQITAMNKEYRENGNWSRFYLVQNTGGHIHSSRNCSTCRPTTFFTWLTDMSGKTEEEAVAEHGAKLCTVCFPSAPLEWTNFWELEEERKAAEFCPASGTTRWAKAPDMAYVYPRGICECGASVSPTSKTTGKIRKHKAA